MLWYGFLGVLLLIILYSFLITRKKYKDIYTYNM